MLVARELEDARILKHQFRETTWTDRMLLEINRLRDPRLLAVKSHEILTGGDMDWWFVRADGSSSFRLTVQAKILHYAQNDPQLWHYEDLAHPRGNPGLQSRTLVGNARRENRAGRSCYPFYIFYNPGAVSPLPRRMTPPAFNGVSVLDGYATTAHIGANKTARTFPISAKRYDALSPMMFSLHELLCAGEGDIPWPEDMADRAAMLWDRLKLAEQIPNAARRTRPIAMD
jgi:hypothetical protein